MADLKVIGAMYCKSGCSHVHEIMHSMSALMLLDNITAQPITATYMQHMAVWTHWSPGCMHGVPTLVCNHMV